jgi:HEPN domain-containing protein
MSVTEAARRHEAMRWMATANEDLRAVALCLAGKEPALASAAFHCQQAVEKILKAALTDAAIPFRRTHDLTELMFSAASAYLWIENEFGDLKALSPWSLAYRYPSAEEEADLAPGDAEIRACLGRIQAFGKQLTAGWIL